MKKNMKSLMLCVVCSFFLFPGSSKAVNNDIVILQNGDRITGEIKKLEAALLEFKTDAMGTLNIEWRFISEIISDKKQSVELTDGSRVLGTLQKPENGDHILVNSAQGPVDVPPGEVISVWPVEATLADRIELDLSFGLDYQKATGIASMNTAIDFSQQRVDRLTESNFRADITRQSDADEQNRMELQAAHEYLLADQRFRTWIGKVESNDATGVDLRLSVGGAFGKYMIKTNNTWFKLAGGLLATKESPENGDSQTSLEAIANIRYRYFRFADPERSLDTTLSIIPSLTDSGRVRGSFRSTFKLELVSDLFWSMELWATHDTQPLSTDVENTDYGLTTSVGWSY